MKCVAIEMGNNVLLNNNLKSSQIALCLTEIKKILEGKSNTMLKKYKVERKRKRKKMDEKNNIGYIV